MLNKLNEYKKDHLPGGKYWNPSDEDCELLNSLIPKNDICESILGLNAWLSGQKPNLKRITKSTLVEILKNKTITWLKKLPEKERTDAINFSQNKRSAVQAIKDDKIELKEKRLKKTRDR